MQQFKIAFAGRAGTGKTTAVKFIQQQFEVYPYRNVRIFSLAHPIKQFVQIVLPDQYKQKPRVLYQKLGDLIRAEEPSAFVDTLLRQVRRIDEVKGITSFLVDDVRYLNEAQELVNNGFTLIVIDRNVEQLQHVSEQQIEKIKQLPKIYTINNNGTLPEYQNSLTLIIQDLIGNKNV